MSGQPRHSTPLQRALFSAQALARGQIAVVHDRPAIPSPGALTAASMSGWPVLRRHVGVAGAPPAARRQKPAALTEDDALVDQEAFIIQALA